MKTYYSSFNQNYTQLHRLCVDEVKFAWEHVLVLLVSFGGVEMKDNITTIERVFASDIDYPL